MSRLKAAQDLVNKFKFNPKQLKLLAELNEDDDDFEYYDGQCTRELKKLTPSILASSLTYFIGITQAFVSEKRIPTGASKIGGKAHYPKSWEWPDDGIFHAQLNLKDFKKFDIEGVFPEKGIIYFFKKEGGETEDFLALFFDGPTTDLQVMPDHKSTCRDPAALTFKPQWAFCVGNDGDDYSTVADLIPRELKLSIKGVLGGSLANEDADIKIFGRPRYWQSEDLHRKSKTNGRELIFHDNLGEGNVHFWLSEADLSKKAFQRVVVTYSGT